MCDKLKIQLFLHSLIFILIEFFRSKLFLTAARPFIIYLFYFVPPPFTNFQLRACTIHSPSLVPFHSVPYLSFPFPDLLYPPSPSLSLSYHYFSFTSFLYPVPLLPILHTLSFLPFHFVPFYLSLLFLPFFFPSLNLSLSPNTYLRDIPDCPSPKFYALTNIPSLLLVPSSIVPISG